MAPKADHAGPLLASPPRREELVVPGAEPKSHRVGPV